MPDIPADPNPAPNRKRPGRLRLSRAGRTDARRPFGPLRSSVRLADFEAALSMRLLRLLAREPGVTGVDEQPEAFEWVDGRDGRDRMHLPLAHVRRGTGDVAFVDAMPSTLLRRDPELGGTRRTIELECRARGASYEIWTENEILEDPFVVQVMRVADTEERAAHALALRSAGPPATAAVPAVPVVATIAARLLIDDMREVGSGWVGRSRLTNIPMALLRDLEIDPATHLLVWRPRAWSRAGTVRGAGARREPTGRPGTPT